MDEFISLVTFESPLHQIWFVVSMGFLLVSCLAVRLGGYRQKFQYLSVLHSVVAVEAILMTLFRPEQREVFSVHCIWFNLLMAGIYFFLTDSPGAKQPDEPAEQKTEKTGER